jgi:hypothetical protein
MHRVANLATATREIHVTERSVTFENVVLSSPYCVSKVDTILGIGKKVGGRGRAQIMAFQPWQETGREPAPGQGGKNETSDQRSP